jgi:hypothetical protein
MRFFVVFGVLGLVLCAIACGFFFFQRGDQGATRVSLSFDDGYKSQLEAAGYLREQGVRATFFVTCLDSFEGKKLLSPAEIASISSFHVIGWHTCHHVNMSVGNLSEVSPLYGATVFSYPYGFVANEDLVKRFFGVARVIDWGYNQPVDCMHVQTITLTHSNFEDGLKYAQRAPPGSWVVFALHDVSDDPRPDVDVTWDEFRRLVSFIKSSGWKGVSLDECKG